MPRVYRRFSKEFKLQIVDAVLKGTPASQIAKANDLHPETVRCWVRDFRRYPKDAFAGRGNTYTDSAKVNELQRQLGQLAAENMVLKKALGRIKELAREKGE
jgi:transposase-like protein